MNYEVAIEREFKALRITRVYTSTELVVTGTKVKGKKPYYEREQKRDGARAQTRACARTRCAQQVRRVDFSLSLLPFVVKLNMGCDGLSDRRFEASCGQLDHSRYLIDDIYISDLK